MYSSRNSAKPRSRPSPTRTAVRPWQIPQCDLWTAPETAPEINRAEKAPLDRTPTKRTPRIKTPQPTVDRPARACGICGEDITQRDPNTRKCRHHRLPLTELRRSRARERKCSDCEAVISLRVHNALRCEECAPEHRTKQGQEIPGSPGEPGKPEQVPEGVLQGEQEKPRRKGQIRTAGRSSAPTLKEPALTR